MLAASRAVRSGLLFAAARGISLAPIMKYPRVLGLLVTLAVLAASLLLAQHTAREADSNSIGTPNWTVDPAFKKDVFTFVRIQYSSHYRGSRRAGRWDTDFPDSDLNFSWRLQQMTSLKVDPNARYLELTDPALFDFPWIYIVEPGRLEFSDEEVSILRNYLLNGGFLMVDDFWGEVQWQNFYEQIKRVFPEYEPKELPMDHPIFRCVFDLSRMQKNDLQIPNIQQGIWAERTHVTWERHDGEECREVHFRAILDDRQRMMVMICHNTDNGDGWEREGESEYYFHEFSEKKAYPLGINIVFYAMTH